MTNVLGGDFKIDSNNGTATTQHTRTVISGTTGSILGGQFVIETAGGWDGNVTIAASGDGTTTHRIAGLAKAQSTETTAAAGVVEVWMPLPGIFYRGAAKVSTNANTQALIDALKGKRVKIDVTAGLMTVDTAQADASTNTIVIVGGYYQTSTIQFVLAPQGTSYFV